MGRPRLELGQCSDIETSPLHLVDGKWKRLPFDVNVRKAKAWRSRARVRNWDGVVVDISARRSTKNKAIAAAQRKIDATLSTGSVELTEATPLAQAAELYLTQIQRTDSNLSDTTVALYRRHVESYIFTDESSIRGLTIGQVNSPSRLRGFLHAVADNHGTATAKTSKSVLSNILNFAVEDGALDSNAVRQVRPVKSQSPKKSERDLARAFTRTEREALLAHADSMATDSTLDPRTLRKREAVADLLAVMAGLGVRIGEARGIRWEHVDLKSGYVKLHGTKSKGARRRLDFPDWLTQRLDARVAHLAKHYRDATRNAKHTDTETRTEVIARLNGYADAVGISGFVFPSPARLDLETPWDQSNSSNAVRKVLDEVGLSFAVPHTFRRTAISWLGEAGVPLAHIADWAGHSDPAMTASAYLARDFEGDKSSLAEKL